MPYINFQFFDDVDESLDEGQEVVNDKWYQVT